MRILQVATVSNTINAFLVPHIRSLIENGHEVELACSITQPICDELIALDVPINTINFDRNPTSKSNRIAYKEFFQLLSSNRYDIVHTHTPIASAIVRLVCRKFKDIKVIYTAHGFHFYKGAPIKNWVIYGSLEKWLLKYTDILLTINEEDYKNGKKMARKRDTKVYKVDGIGISIKYEKLSDKEKDNLRNELGIQSSDIVLTCIAELNQNKNQIEIIKALKRIIDDGEKYKLLLIGEGDLSSRYKEEVRQQGLEKNVLFLGYKSNIHDYLQITDILVSASLREGLPVSIMEGMAHGIPVVASRIRGHLDLLTNYPNGKLYDSDLVSAVYSVSGNKPIIFDLSQYGISSSVQQHLKIYDMVTNFCKEKTFEK